MDTEQTQQNLIKDALIYYDSHQDNVAKFLDKAFYVRFEETDDEEENNYKITFYDKNKTKILTSKIEYLALYVPNTRTFKWAWTIPSFDKALTELSRKMLNYAFTLEVDDFMLKSELLNSKIHVLNEYQHDIHLAISAYLTKKPFIFKFYNAIYDKDDYLPIRCEGDDCKEYVITYIFIMDFA
jgi:hypothetical protein